MFYILDGHEPVLQPDIEAWGEWVSSADLTVARTELPGGVVSTIFTGIVTSFYDPPRLFETMIFDGPDDRQRFLYATWDEALAGHERIVAAITSGHAP